MARQSEYGTDIRRQRSHRWRNLAQTVLLFVGMGGLLALCGWLVGGLVGLIWICLLGAVSLIVGLRVSPRLVLRMFRAEPLSRYEVPELHGIVAELSRRAGLARPPELHFISSRLMNAFSVGTRDEGAIALTGGMLRGLDLRQLTGVLAHEISHLASNDTQVMALADVITRLTRTMSFLGLLLLFLNLPLLATGSVQVSWWLILLLLLAPTVGALLQLALARSREYDADLEAAALTGDPAGLASALQLLERQQGHFWEDILLPGRRMPDPSLLRSHPRTEDRVRRLLSLVPDRSVRQLPLPQDLTRHEGSVPQVRRAPGWHRTGTWY